MLTCPFSKSTYGKDGVDATLTTINGRVRMAQWPFPPLQLLAPARVEWPIAHPAGDSARPIQRSHIFHTAAHSDTSSVHQSTTTRCGPRLQSSAHTSHNNNT